MLSLLNQARSGSCASIVSNIGRLRMYSRVISRSCEIICPAPSELPASNPPDDFSDAPIACRMAKRASVT